jgi:hypothetical protein
MMAPPCATICKHLERRSTWPEAAASGERFLVDHDFSLRHFFLETLPHEVLDIDGKFLRTLRLLLLRPGMLASEYVVGRRQRYVGPLRFYVIAFVLHATLAALLAGHGPSNILGRRCLPY